MTQGRNSGIVTYPVTYNPDYVASEYTFDTNGKAGELVARIESGGSSATLVDPLELVGRPEWLIERAHSPAYVEAVRSGNPAGRAEPQGFDRDSKIVTLVTAHSTCLSGDGGAVWTRPMHWLPVVGVAPSRDNGAGYCTNEPLKRVSHLRRTLSGIRNDRIEGRACL